KSKVFLLPADESMTHTPRSHRTVPSADNSGYPNIQFLQKTLSGFLCRDSLTALRQSPDIPVSGNTMHPVRCRFPRPEPLLHLLAKEGIFDTVPTDLRKMFLPHSVLHCFHNSYTSSYVLKLQLENPILFAD